MNYLYFSVIIEIASSKFELLGSFIAMKKQPKWKNPKYILS